MREVETQRLRRFYWCCQLPISGLGREVVYGSECSPLLGSFPRGSNSFHSCRPHSRWNGEKVLILITLRDLLSFHSPRSVSVLNYWNFMCIRGLENKRGIWKKLAEKKREARCCLEGIYDRYPARKGGNTQDFLAWRAGAYSIDHLSLMTFLSCY